MANDAVRRIMAEVKEFSSLNNQPTTFFSAAPLESDLFEWHFTVRGPPDTAFEHGVYHGRILLPAEYPLKAPEIILLTPNGRFEVGTRICLSVTSHHQETWQPSWGIRTILTALVGFMPSKPEGVGALDYPEDERRGLAKKSHTFYCARCETMPAQILPPRMPAQSESVPTVDDTEVETNPELPSPEEQTASSTDVPREAEETVVTQQSDTASSVNDPPVAVQQTAEEDEVTPVIEGTRVDTVTNEVEPTAKVWGDLKPAQNKTSVQEPELLYVAYAIVAMMLAIVIRRVFKIVTE